MSRQRFRTIHFRPELDIERPDSEYPNQRKFREFNIGDTITWVDEKTFELFNSPAFECGKGAFILLSIRIDRHAPADLEQRPSVGGHVLFEIQTPKKGRKLLSADYFKKLD